MPVKLSDLDPSAVVPPGRATIADVAREAEVSKTTVSRYLSGEFAVLSEPVQARIEAAIARLGYQPSQMARGLKRGHTRLIGVVVADVLNPYSVAVLDGAEAACQQHGYTLALCNTGDDEARERQSLATLRSYSVEGLIVHTQGRNVQPIQQMAAAGLPVVLVDRKLAGFDGDLVGLDNHEAARQATLHLIERGFTDLAFVTAPMHGLSSRQERETSFRQVLMRHPGCQGRTLELDIHEPGLMDDALRGFLASSRGRRGAAVAATGVVTLEVVRALRRLGLKTPDDLGLLGFDELDWSALVGPGITTLAQPTYEIGFRAFECLLERLRGDLSPPRQILLPGRLIPRGSTHLANGTGTPLGAPPVEKRRGQG